jgi:hypothetical protein
MAKSAREIAREQLGELLPNFKVQKNLPDDLPAISDATTPSIEALKKKYFGPKTQEHIFRTEPKNKGSARNYAGPKTVSVLNGKISSLQG